MGQDNVGRERDYFRSVSANGSCIRGSPSGVNLHVAADDPTLLLQPLQERRDPGLKLRIIRGCGKEYCDAPHTLGLLRPYRERPSRHCAADKCDELASSQAHA
jgi:hypothetical protein